MTNGGVLIAVRLDALEEGQALLGSEGYGEFIRPIGRLVVRGEKVVMVEV